MKRLVKWMLTSAPNYTRNTPPFPERGYRWIHQLKDKTRKNIPELIALAPKNDPFFIGSDLDWEKARWFASVWEQLGYTNSTGIHLRRMHYRLVDSRPKKLDGMSYENSERDWEELLACSTRARILNLVPAEAFDDHRNGEPYLPSWEVADVRVPQIELETWKSLTWTPPEINLLFWEGAIAAAPAVQGYDPDDELDTAYLIELWIEKSTQDDILRPLCRELGITLVTSVGFQSITSAVKLLKDRVKKYGKPARIFYISDFDKAGDGMPVSVARQLEFWLPVYAEGADVKLVHLALTRKQVDHYELPRDSKGRVELDALEARRPGELARLVREAVEPYLDPTIPDQLAEAKEEAEQIVEEQWDETMEPHERKLAGINSRVRSIVKKYEKEVHALNKRLQRDVAKFREPVDELRAAVKEAAESFEPELPERPAQNPRMHKSESNWLFASVRKYLEQLAFYKRHQGKSL